MGDVVEKVPSVDISEMVDDKGKLNTFGALLLIGFCCVCLDKFFELYVTDKKHSN